MWESIVRACEQNTAFSWSLRSCYFNIGIITCTCNMVQERHDYACEVRCIAAGVCLLTAVMWLYYGPCTDSCHVTILCSMYWQLSCGPRLDNCHVTILCSMYWSCHVTILWSMHWQVSCGPRADSCHVTILWYMHWQVSCGPRADNCHVTILWSMYWQLSYDHTSACQVLLLRSQKFIPNLT
jgi:hypothetical protein